MAATTADQSSFAFLAAHGPLYLRLALDAERALSFSPSLALASLRQLSEALAQFAAARTGVSHEGYGAPGQADLLRLLEQRGVVTDQIADAFHMLRRVGNRAVHDFVGSYDDALNALRIAFRIACWFHKSFGDKDVRGYWKPPVYVPPADPAVQLRVLQAEAQRARAEADAHKSDAAKAKALLEAEAAQRIEEAARRQAAELERAEWESLAAAYQRDLDLAAAEQARLVAAAATSAATAPAAQAEAIAQATTAASSTVFDERDTRVLIDAQLRDAGWEVDSQALRWPTGARPEKGRNRAIAEVPTFSKEDGAGSADYVLYVGLVPYAVVEAKKKSRRIPSALEQAKRYARGLAAPPSLAASAGTTHASEGPPASWGWATSLTPATSSSPSASTTRYQVPFLFATNGRPYLRQLETESGVWFLDARHPTNHPRALRGWYTPEALRDLLLRDPHAADARLSAEPADAMSEALRLRAYQTRAITAVEEAIARGQRSLLVAMATGTGKTRTTVGLIHRLLRSQRFHRILFLVDRSSLGKQAFDAFADVRLENGQSFSQNYSVMGTDEQTPERETKVQIATVQSMVRRVLWPAADAPPVPIDRYDCVIVDESHRGYTLDREMTEGEQELRGFEDYVSTYRRVLDHFDAVKIGLTATPAQHTREIFGPPVFVYSYPEAVADGFLVDHEPPIRITTQLARHGISFDKGAEITTLRPGGEVQLSMLPDEMAFEVSAFNRTVITDGFNRAVAGELAQHLDPHGPAKTIVFCVDDDHAERLVPILKDALEAVWGPIDDGLVKKITGATDHVADVITHFKNEALPKIAVTVDLLSTGIDVPKVSNIVFLRRIRSRILYEQMLGRATRLCPEIKKEVFRVFDAVGLYDVLSEVSDMKPLVKQVSRATAELVSELLDPRSLTAPGHEAGRTLADEVLRELVERLRRVVRRLGDPGKVGPVGASPLPAQLASTIDSLEAAMGCPLAAVPDALRDAGAPAAIQLLTSKPELVVLLGRLAAAPGYGTVKVVAPHDDAVIAVERGYGDGRARPEDYLAAFQAYVEQHRNEIAALTVVCTRPRDLTRAQLRELKVKLDTDGYSEADLRAAYRDWKNQDIAATIIGFIRQRALGSPLVPYSARVDRAVAKVLSTGTWTMAQRTWLQRIAAQLKLEVIVDEQAFAADAFESHGGWKGIDKLLGGRLRQVMDDLGAEIWNDEAA